MICVPPFHRRLPGRMADQLRPYIFGSSPSVGSSDRSADEESITQSGESSGSPLLTVSDINPDMLKVTDLTRYNKLVLTLN